MHSKAEQIKAALAVVVMLSHYDFVLVYAQSSLSASKESVAAVDGSAPTQYSVRNHHSAS